MKDKENKCKKIIVFAGTTEGRKLVEKLMKYSLEIYVSVATEYGGSLFEESPNVKVSAIRKEKGEMISYLTEIDPILVVDATHPYAVEVTNNIKECCNERNVKYIRLLREHGEITAQKENRITYVDSMEMAVKYLQDTTGNVLVTTGSKELQAITKLNDYKERIYARVLSLPSVVEACHNIGVTGAHLCCMQGPFSYDFNKALLKQCNAKYLLTKDSGKTGGIYEKCQAAFDLDVHVILIGRPMEVAGQSFTECMFEIKQYFQLKDKKNITLVGIGTGSFGTMTNQVSHVCGKAELIIGAKRMVDAVVQDPNQQLFYSYNPKEICEYIKGQDQVSDIVIVLSGDVGFFSGAKKLMQQIDEMKLASKDEITVLPGISSLSYFFAKIQKSYENVPLISIHGRDQSVMEHLKKCGKVFAIVGSVIGIRKICGQLIEFGLQNTKVWIGERLSYDNEVIYEGSPETFLNYNGDALSVLYLEANEDSKYLITPGISDEAFIRGKVPMTKEEIRSISICKLQLTEDAVVYDVGAGTGSVSIEVARLVTKGKVYAIEKKSVAVEILKENKKHFAASNLEIVEGMAPEVLEELEIPTHAFIGGSSGNLREILELLMQKNPNIVIVLNAITLETIAEATQCAKVLEKQGKKIDIVSVSVAKSNILGNYHMMIGHNPVHIFTFS